MDLFKVYIPDSLIRLSIAGNESSSLWSDSVSYRAVSLGQILGLLRKKMQLHHDAVFTCPIIVLSVPPTNDVKRHLVEVWFVLPNLGHQDPSLT